MILMMSGRMFGDVCDSHLFFYFGDFYNIGLEFL